MADYNTKLTFGVDVKGATAAQKALDDLNKKAVDGAKKQVDSATMLADALAKAADDAKKAADAVEQSAKRGDKAQSDAAKAARVRAKQAEQDAARAGAEQEKALKKLQNAKERAARNDTMRNARVEDRKRADQVRTERDQQRQAQREKAVADREAERARVQQQRQAQQAQVHRAALGQGFLQGILPEARYIDRGRGALRQAAGIYAGTKLRQGVSSVAALPFAGAGGLGNVARSIPVLGGILGGQIDQMMADSGAALGRQRSQMGNAPFLGGFGLRTMGGRGAGAFVTDEQIHAQAVAAARTMPLSSLPKRQQATLYSRIRSESASEINDLPADKQEAYIRAAGGDVYGRTLPSVSRRVRQDALTGVAEQRLLRQRDSARNAPASQSALGDIGRNLGGMTLEQSQGFAVNAAMAGGGTAARLQQQGLLATGIAAQTTYGVGADVTGAFGAAGRLGGIAGGTSQGGAEGLARTIGRAVSLGLDGADLTKFTEQTAQGINNWRQTGIPLASDAIYKLAGGLKGTGMAAPLAVQGAQGITSTLQNIGDQGANDAFGLAALQGAGGDQSSLEGQLAAQRRLREGDSNSIAGSFASVARRTIGGTGARGEVGYAATLNLAKRFNMPTDADSIRKLQRRFARGQFSMAQAAGGADMTPQGLQASAAARVDPSLVRDAAQADARTDIGEGGIKSRQDADQAALIVSQGVTGALKGPLEGITSALLGLTQFLNSHVGTGTGNRAAAGAFSASAGTP
jgi:hypothetical protein